MKAYGVLILIHFALFSSLGRAEGHKVNCPTFLPDMFHSEVSQFMERDEQLTMSQQELNKQSTIIKKHYDYPQNGVCRYTISRKGYKPSHFLIIFNPPIA